jgi:general secretion pathway protein C
MKRLPVLISFLLFLALGASLSYWVLQWLAPATRPVVVPAPAERALPGMAAAANLFGGTTEVVSSTPIQLKGIIRAAKPSESVAIIALEGKPARALKVNAEVSNGIVIKEINARTVLVSDHGVEREVRLQAFASRSPSDANNSAGRNSAPVEPHPTPSAEPQKEVKNP